MTTDHEASRTLVKSPPELWAECSDATSLSRHLSESFGEIRITRLEPETAVAWEGERASGTVRIEPSAWGTRVTLTAQAAAIEEIALAAIVESEQEVVDEEVVEAAPLEPVAEAAPRAGVPEAPASPPVVQRPRGLIARLKWWFSPPEEVAAAVAVTVAERAQPEPEPVAAPEPEPPALEPEPPEPAPSPSSLDADAALAAALDSLGRAHHRPFSRA